MESFDQLVIQYTPMIHKIIQSLNIYRNQEEFYQTGLIGLWEANNGFDPKKGNFTNYAYSFIKGKILLEMANYRKHEERNAYPKGEFWEVIKDQAPAQPLELELLLSYCQELTERETKWVLATCLYGLSASEIAEKEQVSVSAVKQWKMGALRKLRASLKFF